MDAGQVMQVLMTPHFAALGVLHIHVRRDHILEDAMQQLQLHMDDLRKPLKVTFLGGEHGNIREEAVDEGGCLPLRVHPSVMSIDLAIAIM
jgi:hypothetical protein